jgi:hypothetical protein
MLGGSNLKDYLLMLNYIAAGEGMLQALQAGSGRLKARI